MPKQAFPACLLTGAALCAHVGAARAFLLWQMIGWEMQFCSDLTMAIVLKPLQAVACIGLIIAGGRTLLRPIYRRMADMGNTDVFAATTLLVVLGTSVLTQIAGLSLALGAFLVCS